MYTEYYDIKGNELKKSSFHAEFKIEIPSETSKLVKLCTLYKKCGSKNYSVVKRGPYENMLDILGMYTGNIRLRHNKLGTNSNNIENITQDSTTNIQETMNKGERDENMLSETGRNIDRIGGTFDINEDAVYYDYTKHETTRQKALWRIINGGLEIRCDSKNWENVSLFGKTPMEVLMQYPEPIVLYYDKFNYPLDESDKEFAVSKYLEYKNGMAIKICRSSLNSTWHYGKLVTKSMNKYKYFDKAVCVDCRSNPDGSKYRIRRESENTRAAFIDEKQYDGEWRWGIGKINGYHLKEELEQLVRWGIKTTYFDKDGNGCDKLADATFKKVTISEENVRVYKIGADRSLKLEFMGVLHNATTFILDQAKKNKNSINTANQTKIVAQVQQSDTYIRLTDTDKHKVVRHLETDNANAAKHTESVKIGATSSLNSSNTSSNVISKVMKKLGENSEFSTKSLENYIVACVLRNRRIQKTPIINIRLIDRLGQSIYVYDYGYKRKSDNIDINKIWVVDSLEQAKKFCIDEDIEIESLPDPLQWSDNPYDYIWNPLIKVSPLSADMLDLIYKQSDLNEILRDKDIQSVISEIRKSCLEGELMARTDISYALPYYNIRQDSVSMMLPLRSRILSGDKVLNAMVFNKNLLGYSLYGIISVEDARESVRLFRDVSMTWLKEA